jgi:hypothetical protein
MAVFPFGTVTSGSFFDDLRRIDVGGELQYKKRGRVVKEYPESLTTSIHLIGRCPAEFGHSPTSIFRGNSCGLKLEVNWKHEMQMRPAVLSPVAAQCVGYSAVVIPAGDLITDVAVPLVDCQMTVASKGVLLGDHLIVSISTADGRTLTGSPRLRDGPLGSGDQAHRSCSADWLSERFFQALRGLLQLPLESLDLLGEIVKLLPCDHAGLFDFVSRAVGAAHGAADRRGGLVQFARPGHVSFSLQLVIWQPLAPRADAGER